LVGKVDQLLEWRKQNRDTMNTNSLDAETNDRLKKAKLGNGAVKAEQHDSNRKPFPGELVIKDEERMEPIPSNGAELVRLNPGELVDLAPLGSVQITVFVMMLIAGIFQGYGNLALAYTATDFSKALGMTPVALAAAFTAGLFGVMAGALLFGQLADRIGVGRPL
jgi:hypothetical protein